MRNPVTVRKLKFDGSVRSEWTGDLVDANDAWLAVYHDPDRHQKLEDIARETLERSYSLRYVGLLGPLSVLFTFDERGRFLDAKCDAALPGRIEERIVSFVDLDLDVVVLPGGQHYIRDQAVFAERSVSMGYPDEVQRKAHQGILHALRMVRRGRFPFDGSAEALLGRVMASEGPL